MVWWKLRRHHSYEGHKGHAASCVTTMIPGWKTTRSPYFFTVFVFLAPQHCVLRLVLFKSSLKKSLRPNVTNMPKVLLTSCFQLWEAWFWVKEHKYNMDHMSLYQKDSSDFLTKVLLTGLFWCCWCWYSVDLVVKLLAFCALSTSVHIVPRSDTTTTEKVTQLYAIKSKTTFSLAAVLTVQWEEWQILIWIMISFHHKLIKSFWLLMNFIHLSQEARI